MEEPHAEELFGVSVLSHFAVADAHAAGEYMSRVSVAEPIVGWVVARYRAMDRCYRFGLLRWVHVESTNAALTWNCHQCNCGRRTRTRTQHDTCAEKYRAGIEATARQALPIKAREWSGWNSGTTDASTIDSCHVTIDSVGDSFGMHSPSFFGIAFEVAGRKSAWKDDGTDGAETLEAEDRRIWDDNLPLLYLGFSWL